MPGPPNGTADRKRRDLRHFPRRYPRQHAPCPSTPPGVPKQPVGRPGIYRSRCPKRGPNQFKGRHSADPGSRLVKNRPSEPPGKQAFHRLKLAVFYNSASPPCRAQTPRAPRSSTANTRLVRRNRSRSAQWPGAPLTHDGSLTRRLSTTATRRTTG